MSTTLNAADQLTSKYTKVTPPLLIDDDLLRIPLPEPMGGTNKSHYVEDRAALLEQNAKLIATLKEYAKAVADYQRLTGELERDLAQTTQRTAALQGALAASEAARRAAEDSLESIQSQLDDATEADNQARQQFANAESSTTRAIRAVHHVARMLDIEFVSESTRRDFMYLNGVRGGPLQLICQATNGWSFEFYPDKSNGGKLIVVDSNGKHHTLRFDDHGVDYFQLLGLHQHWNKLNTGFNESFDRLPTATQRVLNPTTDECPNR